MRPEVSSRMSAMPPIAPSRTSWADLVGEVVGVDLVGQFGDHQALASLDLFDTNNGSLSDGAASRTVGILNSTVAQNRCAGGEIGAGNELDQSVKQFFARGLGVVQRPLHAACDFTQVVRGGFGWPYRRQYLPNH